MALPNPGMSFTPFDPLPASDLNDLVENIEALQDWSAFDTGTLPANLIDFSSDSEDANGGVWWQEIKRTTLGSNGDLITVSSIPARSHLKIIIFTLATGGNNTQVLTFNNDSGANYARVQATDYGTATTQVSQNSLILSDAAGAGVQVTSIEPIINRTTQEKLFKWNTIRTGTAGAGNLPSMRMGHGKWANTSDQINRVDIANGSTGDFSAGSRVIVLGHD